MDSDCESDDKESQQSEYRDLWLMFDGLEQPDDAPVGSSQSCYWTEGMMICRTKNAEGKWEYFISD